MSVFHLTRRPHRRAMRDVPAVKSCGVGYLEFCHVDHMTSSHWLITIPRLQKRVLHVLDNGVCVVGEEVIDGEIPASVKATKRWLAIQYSRREGSRRQGGFG